MLVPSFDDPWIVEGQGSVGTRGRRADGGVRPARAERTSWCRAAAAGWRRGSRSALPEAEIIVVEPEGWDDMRRSRWTRAGS